MARMTEEECRRFLTESLHTMKVATVRKDGSPHIAPVWFDLDNDDLIFTTSSTTAKAAHMRHDSRVCICVDDERPPFSFVTIYGTAVMTSDASELLYWATRIGGKYMGEEQAEAYGRRNAVEGEMLVRVTPSKIIAEKNIAE